MFKVTKCGIEESLCPVRDICYIGKEDCFGRTIINPRLVATNRGFFYREKL